MLQLMRLLFKSNKLLICYTFIWLRQVTYIYQFLRQQNFYDNNLNNSNNLIILQSDEVIQLKPNSISTNLLKKSMLLLITEASLFCTLRL